MASASVQFHATIDEIVSLVEEWQRQYQPCIVGVRFQPFEAWEVPAAQVSDVMRSPGVRRLLFTLKAPRLPAGGNNELLDKNPDALILDVGHRSESSLQESGLSTLEANDTWKRMIQHLRRSTQAGAVAINPKTGAKGKLRAHRHTSGARALADQGVVMRPWAGGTILRFGTE